MLALRWRRALAAPVVVLLSMNGVGSGSAVAWADGGDASTDALAAARSLFTEALRDENARRFDVALEKFLRVQRVKDTAPVEYRIGSCHEGLGHPALAYAAYRTAVTLGQDDPAMVDVVQGARGRLDVLAHHVARLTLTLPPDAPADTAVKVDDVTVEASALRDPVPLEPGTHTVVATAGDTVPFRSEVALPEGGQASLTVALVPRSRPPPPPPPPPSISTDDGSTRHTWGWVALGAGGVLIAGSVVTTLLRHGDISSLDTSCPGGRCPPGSNQSDLESTRSRALAEGPVAVALGATGILAAGIGAYLLLTSPAAPTATTGHAWLAPYVDTKGAGAAMAGVF